jgi:hypothetical protein
MTLAAVFFFVSLAAPAISGAPQQSPNAAVLTSGKQEGTTATQEQNPASTSRQAKKPSQGSSSARRRHKKKTVKPDCGSSKPITPNSSAPPDSSTGQPTPSSSATQPSSNCPPPKIVIQQGGTTEPSIQLAGGPSTDQAGQKRDAVTQLLATTDQNLKQVAGLQLSAEQQDTATQARQFMEQSKAALAAADLERARTLAWKAQLLSEDLLKPQK